MKQEIKNQWLTALRSGEYKQGQHVLRTCDNKFCCLGVLTDLAVKAGVLPEGEIVQNAFFVYTNGQDRGNQGDVLPIPVAEWAGIKSINPVAQSVPQTLAVLNDEGKSFEEIAKIVETDF